MATRQVRCVRAFGRAVPGDVAEVPEGAAVDPVHWEDVPPEVTVTVDDTAARAAVAGVAGRVTTTLKEA